VNVRYGTVRPGPVVDPGRATDGEPPAAAGDGGANSVPRAEN
jgi:hypothetical protein